MRENFKGTREVIRYCHPYIRGRTIDLGAGSAKYKNIIMLSASEYVAFDISPGEDITLVGDIVDTGLPDHSFDTVICTQVFEHIPKPWLAAKEISRLLKSGGVCIVTAPFIQASHADPQDYFRYTPEGLKSLFGDGGFEIIEAGTYGRTFASLFDFIKMVWFSPYQKRKKGAWTFTHLLESFGHRLDRFVKNKIIYANAYLIARKV